MQMTRSEQRKKAMEILYQVDIYKQGKINYDIKELISQSVPVVSKFITDLVNGVLDNIEAIDEKANKYLEDWTISRLDKTGANILRIAIYELCYTETPKIVAINEGVELAKIYSDENVRKMINAVLDKIVKEEYNG